MTLEVKGNNTLAQEVKRIMNEEEAPYSDPWHPSGLEMQLLEPFKIKGMTFENWKSHWNDSLAADKRQAKVLSNIIIRFIQSQMAQFALRQNDAKSTIAKRKIIFVTATPIGRKEFENIKAQLREVRGGSDQFSIEVVMVTDDERNSSIELQQELDDLMSDLHDIYDVTLVNAFEYWRRGPSGILLAKMFHSEDRKIDQMRLKKLALYGPTVLASNVRERCLLWLVISGQTRYHRRAWASLPGPGSRLHLLPRGTTMNWLK